MKINSLTFQGSLIKYRVTGYGIPVVLLHGFGEDGQVWEPFFDDPELKARLIIPDLPGSGMSELIREEEAGMELYARVLDAIVQQEEINHFILIGHSMGGYISLEYLAKWPKKLMGLGMFHSTALADSEEKKEARAKSIQFILEHGAAAFLDTAIHGLFAHPQQHTQAIERLLNDGAKFQAEALVQYYKAMINRRDNIHLLKETSIPVLWIMGTEDKAVPFQQSLSQCSIAPVSMISVLRGSGHMGMIEETAQSRAILGKFLQFQAMINN